jgi:hypothetical protein
MVVWKIKRVTAILAELILGAGLGVAAEQRKITAREAAQILRDYVWWQYPHLAPSAGAQSTSPGPIRLPLFLRVDLSRTPAGVAVGHYAIRKRYRYSDQQYAELAARTPVPA